MTTINQIRKRDGNVVSFDVTKIIEAAFAALKVAGTPNREVAEHLSVDVVQDLLDKGYDQKEQIPSVELVQDLLENAFVKRGLTHAAKAFIIYREEHKKAREGKHVMVDVKELVEGYLDQEDWRVNENSNSGYSYASLLNHVSGAVVANYTLSNIYPSEIAQAHVDGDLHLHDLSCGIVGYCAGHSLRELLEMGFRGRNGRSSANPAKHFDTALLQAVNFLCTLQTEWAGAQAFSSFDTFMAPFIRHDRLEYDQVKQCMQQFIFGLNIASRWGQCVTMDVKCLKADGNVASYDELKIGDEIITFDVETGKLKTDTITHLTKKPHNGVAHKYVWAGNGTRRIQFTVTPEHRMVHRVKDKYYIAKSDDLFNTHEYLSIPEVSLCPGFSKHVGKDDFPEYVYLNEWASPYMASEVEIDEDVWCPTTNTGTFVAYVDGALIIVGNCPFTNLTFDWVVPEDLKDHPVILGGKLMDTETYGDFQPEMDMINKAFLEVMAAGDSDGRIFTFPIPTYNITKDFNWDSENAKLLFEVTGKYGLPYFQNFINSDLHPSDVRSMCPLSSDTEVLSRTTEKGVHIRQIGDMYSKQVKGASYEVWTSEGWQPAKVVRFESPQTLLRVHLSNGTFVDMTGEHLQPVKGGKVLHGSELQPGMWIPFNKTPVEGTLGSYDMGYAVGAYIGDGSRSRESAVYTICAEDKSTEVANRLTQFWNGLGFDVDSEFVRDKVRYIRVASGSYPLLKRYVSGNTALNKGMTHHVFNSSDEFKQGVLQGLADTDGCRTRKRLYTSSAQLRKDLLYLFGSMGRKSLSNYVDSREGRLGSNDNFRIDYPERERYGNLYDSDDQYNYYAITEIEEVKSTSPYVYCVELDTEDHLFMLANGMMTHNCRLRMDLRQLDNKTGGLFGAGEKTGSLGVVTINLPRIAYLSKTEGEFFERLDKMILLAKEALEIKRKVIQNNLDNDLMPYTKVYLKTLNNHFSTIGLVGANEACLNYLGCSIGDSEGLDFAVKILKHMKEKIADIQEETGHIYNLEATPAEGTSFRLAKIDKKKFPEIITAGDKNPYYTNSTQLPVGYTADLFEALDLQEPLQKEYTGGTVFHAFIGERIDDPKLVAELVKRIATNYRIPYFTLTPSFSICPVHGYIPGEHANCPYAKS